jgi:hypothetical protein
MVYKIIISPVVLYEYEMSFILREEYKLQVFGNKVLRKHVNLRRMK